MVSRCPIEVLTRERVPCCLLDKRFDLILDDKLRFKFDQHPEPCRGDRTGLFAKAPPEQIRGTTRHASSVL